MEFTLTSDLLAAICGVVLTLLFSYLPGLSVRFAGLPAEIKRLIMLGLLVLTSAAIYALTCTGIVASGITCDQPGVIRLVSILITAIIANQGIYSISPSTTAVMRAKIER